MTAGTGNTPGAVTITSLTGNETMPIDAGGAVVAQVKTSTIAALASGSSSSSLVGFYGATPIAQPSGAAQAAITDSSAGTASPTTGVGATTGYVVVAIPITMANLANSQTYAFDPGFAGKIIAINYRATVAVTTSGKAATIQAQANGTNTTGGAIALSGAYAIGAAQAGSAVTAANAFTAGQTIGFTAGSVTTFIEGAGVIEFTLLNTDTANSIATIVAQTNAVRLALVDLGLIKGAA